MALSKVTYVNGVTVITAENLNDIQDAIIALEGNAIPAPASPNYGDFLCWNGSAWAATSVPSANGVSF